ncbi:MAG TPA: AIR synthase-related protein, partial [Patescibacteria group bacterium]|nr:AIR synthase-related protein [Patescibacteria group bacterium]
KAELPVLSAPSLSGSAVGIIAPTSRQLRSVPQLGDIIIGVPSSGVHSNGISLVIKRAMGLPDAFLTKLPSGRSLGEEALIPTCSYVALMEALLENEVVMHAVLPGTGDGVGKIAFDKRPFTYRIHSWVKEIPPLFLFMQELGVEFTTLLKTFNWGVGYYLFVPKEEVDRCLGIGQAAGYEPLVVGRVEEGERRVIFGPASDLVLPPPGE